MEITRKLIKRQSLEKLYNSLSASRKVYAPVAAGENKTEYRYNPPFAEITFDHIRSSLSVKNVVFPKVENLFYYDNSKTESTISDLDPEKIPELVLWGSHPCDNAAFEVLKSIFCWDITDAFFSKRLEKLAVIGLSCHTSDEYCFCTSVGLKPDSVKGSDILLSRTKSGDYLADILTEKGKQIAGSAPDLFEPAGDEKPVITDVRQKFIHKQVTEKLAKAFESPFWVENSLRCIGCGACAYVCPTCACFDIQDETRGRNGRRYRSWDSCGFGLFTLHTSGHNPRHVQSQRWRQRIMHKFSYMPERNESLGCVGCGRCSVGCPVDMNIAEQLEALQNI
jgi:formate hydrogenlyase subunit 6/NADH:ubiquinone oxidoreductase subunit I